MNTLMQGINRFVRDEEGMAMVEYGLLGALIAIVCVASIRAIGTDLNAVFVRIGTCLTTGTCPAPAA